MCHWVAEASRDWGPFLSSAGLYRTEPVPAFQKLSILDMNELVSKIPKKEVFKKEDFKNIILANGFMSRGTTETFHASTKAGLI